MGAVLDLDLKQGKAFLKMGMEVWLHGPARLYD
jgi:hypothetical protein